MKIAAQRKTTSSYSCFEVHVLSVANLMYNWFIMHQFKLALDMAHSFHA